MTSTWSNLAFTPWTGHINCHPAITDNRCYTALEARFPITAFCRAQFQHGIGKTIDKTRVPAETLRAVTVVRLLVFGIIGARVETRALAWSLMWQRNPRSHQKVCRRLWCAPVHHLARRAGRTLKHVAVGRRKFILLPEAYKL